MGWNDNRHVCNLPLRVHSSVGKVGQWFECEHCKLNWQVQAKVMLDPTPSYGQYGLTFVRREGCCIITRSWQEEE